MHLEGTRFGDMDIDDGRVIHFPSGLFGFIAAKTFVLLERKPDSMIAWLQSIDTPGLAFPVVPGEMFGTDYPMPSAQDLARENRLPEGPMSVFVIVAAKPGGAGLSANLLAPLIIEVESRHGVQVVLDPNRYAVAMTLPSAEATTSTSSSKNL